MAVPWKLLGLAGLAGGVVASGAVVRRRRIEGRRRDLPPDELRAALHERLDAARARASQATPA